MVERLDGLSETFQCLEQTLLDRDFQAEELVNRKLMTLLDYDQASVDADI